MKSYTFLLLLSFLALLPGPARCQESPMISDLTVIPFTVSENLGSIELSWSKQQIQSSYKNFEVIRITDIRLEDNDLQISYSLPHQETGLGFAIGVTLEASDGTLVNASPKAFRVNFKDDQKNPNLLTWRNLAADNIEIGKTYTLLIRTDIYGDICTTKPTLNINKQLPYYGGVVLGLGLIGAGQLYKRQADLSYDNYRQLWENGNNNDRSLLDQVDQDNKTARLLTYTGIGVLCADAVLYYFKNSSYRKALRRYQTFCVGKQEISIHPKYNSSTNMGFMLRLNF